MSQDKNASEKSKTDFQEFQKQEYERVAEAHFKTIDAISSFFRYYLIIMSLPATAAALILSRDRSGDGVSLLQLSPHTEAILGMALLVVAGIGFCLLLYVMNLRMDGILYARTVNAIRKYFYDQAKEDLVAKQQLRVLPQTRYLPPYYEFRYFGPVVTTFLLFNLAYFVAGFALWSHGWVQDYFPVWLGSILVALFIVLHFRSYKSYARTREHGYLETSAIGIDIDGVLNQHREQFCQILASKTQIVISADDIKRLPVSSNADLGISNDNEITVFHTPSYWTDMPVIEGTARILKKLRKELGLRVHIFSYRPWPVPMDIEVDLKIWSSEMVEFRRAVNIRGNNRTLWRSLRSLQLTVPSLFLLSLRNECELQFRSIGDRWLAFWRRIYVRLPWVQFIDRITHVWLYKHGMQYDRLIIEKGHTNLASPNARFVNRFNIARRNSLRFFVEDDLAKAEKLAHICDVVFLMDHPYNQKSDLAANIRRVKTWEDIYNEVKALS